MIPHSLFFTPGWGNRTKLCPLSNGTRRNNWNMVRIDSEPGALLDSLLGEETRHPNFKPHLREIDVRDHVSNIIIMDYPHYHLSSDI